jgi:hypothetical protein
MRQSLNLGPPRLREQLSASRIINVDPLPDALLERIYSSPEDDRAIKEFIAAQSFDLEQ